MSSVPICQAAVIDGCKIELIMKAREVSGELAGFAKPTLHGFLQSMHSTILPRTYLEVGVSHGDSLRLALCAAVGIDPAPVIELPLPATTHVAKMTGDDFFAQRHPLDAYYQHGDVRWQSVVRRPRLIKRWLQGAPRRNDGERFAELALIDGMHHAEFALRDFMNVEQNSAPWSVIVFDDMLPQNHEQALRTRATVAWTGDVFRLHKVLNTYRPDLVTVLVDTEPTGVLVVFAPNHLDERLRASYDQIVAENVQEDPQVVPDEVLQRSGALSAELFFSIGLFDVIRTARERRESSAWVAREIRASLARSGLTPSSALAK